MLTRLCIENIAVIEKTEIEFFSGLNVITGETGAGKSILIDAIGMVLGQRTSKDIIRTGENKACVTAVFYIADKQIIDALSDIGITAEEDGTLHLYRELSMDGRSVCRANGVITPLSIVKEAGKLLVGIHGQQDNGILYTTARHIEVLDAFAGDALNNEAQQYTALFNKYTQLKKNAEQFENDMLTRERDLELYSYQINDIEAAQLKAGEDEELERQQRFIANAQRIYTALDNSYSLLYGSNANARDNIAKAIKELNPTIGFDQKLQEYYNELSDISYRVEDIARELNSYKENIEYEPSKLNLIEERLEQIKKLKRKYGSSIEEILLYLTTAIEKRQQLSNAADHAEEVEHAMQEALTELKAKAMRLNKLRQAAAQRLKNEIVKQLNDLEMKNVGFMARIDFNEDKYTVKGCDTVEFLISPNQGEELKPLSKIASGGELSRIMLAIKAVLSKNDSAVTYIFDEIDTGVSGRAAQKVAQKLYSVSKHKQSLCISHLAQIAGMADKHYLIEKNISKGRTSTAVKCLIEEERIQEIARIIGGANITQLALGHARDMLMQANIQKESSDL